MFLLLAKLSIVIVLRSNARYTSYFSYIVFINKKLFLLFSMMINIGYNPTISVDNSAGCQLYLSKDSLEASITTAKSSEINVLVPGPDNDMVEHALPQQYIHSFKDGQFLTTLVSHSGG
ncbi:hypothetical protein LXL04_023369 [Taraxacum kok-saghyz]